MRRRSSGTQSNAMTDQAPALSPASVQSKPDNVGWNFAVNVWDIAFISLGLSLISRDTVLPALASTLTDSKLAIGMIAAIFTMGFYLPQLFSANISERMVYKKPFVATVGFIGERLPYLLIGVSLYLFAVDAPGVALILLFVFLGVAATSAGIATPAWYDMIAKVIPVHRRGIWSGLGHGLGAVLSVGVLFLVARPVMDRVAYPNNFVMLFLLAFVACVVSWCGLVLTREPPSAGVKESVPQRAYFRRLPAVLRRDPNYTRYLVSRSVVQLATMSSAFYIVYGGETFGIDAAGVVSFTIVSVASVAVMNLVWGLLGDRFGHKLILTLAAFSLTVAAVIALSSPSPAAFALTFALTGAYLAADGVSGLNIILEFCSPEDRPTYIGLTYTLVAPFVIAAPLIGAFLAQQMGYRSMFSVTLGLSALGGTLLWLWVKEPREATLQGNST